MQNKTPAKRKTVKLSELGELIRQKDREADMLWREKQTNEKAALIAAYECGQMLIQAKQIAGHGKFLPWLAQECPAMHERTAQRRMLIAANPSCLSDSPSQSKALALLSAPDEKPEQDRSKLGFVNIVEVWLGKFRKQIKRLKPLKEIDPQELTDEEKDEIRYEIQQLQAWLDGEGQGDT